MGAGIFFSAKAVLLSLVIGGSEYYLAEVVFNDTSDQEVITEVASDQEWS